VDTEGTLIAENVSYSTEAAGITQTTEARRTEIQVTAQAAGTQVGQMQGANRVLLATVRAGETPTIGVVANPAPITGTPGVVNSSPAQFTDIRTASTIRKSDDCADQLQTEFPADSPKIYITAHAFNIHKGTRMGVEWRYQGNPAHQESFVVPRDDDDYCLWFFIDPTMVQLSPGQWSVRLFANDAALDPAVSFTIVPTSGGS
jgi:hypothetical protein